MGNIVDDIIRLETLKRNPPMTEEELERKVQEIYGDTTQMVADMLAFVDELFEDLKGRV